LYGLKKKKGSMMKIKAATLMLFTVAVLLSVFGCEKADREGSAEDRAAADVEESTVSTGSVTGMANEEPVMVPMQEITAGAADESRSTAVSVSDAVSADEVIAEPETPVADTVSGNEEDMEETSETVEDVEETASEVEDVAADAEGVFTSEPIPDDVFARMSGVSYPEGCSVAREDLRYLRLSYHDFNGGVQVGEMVCSKKIADDLVEIFRELYRQGYQIDKMKLIDDYGGDDDLSCADNNTSCFNYRTVAGSTSLSKHALGLAVDINPFNNPYVTYPDGKERISPPGSEPYADRSANLPHMTGPGDAAYELFKAHGFKWGGSWKTLKDYQHFQKT
jgi:hypothetical protein